MVFSKMNEQVLQCPYCWERITILVEEAMEGEWIEDCEVCCNPIHFKLSVRKDGSSDLHYERAQ